MEKWSRRESNPRPLECHASSGVRKPVIAAVNGHAVGIGLTLAMQWDIRLVAREAKLAFAHVRRGVLPDAHSHWTVPGRSAGRARPSSS